MRRLTILLLAATLTLVSVPAMAQSWSGALVMGDEGITAAAEFDMDGGIFRAGVISRQGGSQYDPTISMGLRLGENWITVDPVLDLERMHPNHRANNPDEPIDFRGRIGLAVHVTHRHAILLEYSRSFHNETLEGRWMLGARFGL